ncbi:CPS_collapsed_G0027960.mRNA.1.CDS.1 [Saccharomyces cerevisiae]|nr:CPS_collapsed_G0027960.mRNA.1.CDS.1 [Saccharomyces cerevisiae]
MDPTFSNESFTRHLREYIVPEILEAEAPFNVYAAQQKIFKEQDVYADGRILDIRGVEIVSAKLLAPKTSQSWWSGVEHKKSTFTGKKKTGEIAAGDEANILMSSYAMVFTRDPEQIDDDETEGWEDLGVCARGF